MIKTFQIWRKAQAEYNESQDAYIGYRRSRKEAEDWIDTQKNQAFGPDQYYIKAIGPSGAEVPK